MRHKAASRADLERLALWLTVESPDLRPHIGQAVDIAQGVSNAGFWGEAKTAPECHVEVPFAIHVPFDGALPTVVRGVIDLVYRSADGWRILDYKTDQVSDAAVLIDRYSNQIEQYADAWSRVTTAARPVGALYSVRTGQLVKAV